MLKITRSGNNGTVRMMFEGKLLGPWLDEVREQFEWADSGKTAIDLDLSGISYVDEPGASLLRDLMARGVRIVACSSFVAEVLKLERT